MGEKKIDIVTEGGRQAVATYQIADVTRPLCAVSKMCDKGNTVIFEKNGGVSIAADGSRTTFRREANVYMLGMCMRTPSSSSFTRRS